MAQQRTIDYQGRKVQAEVVDFEPALENWTLYRLADGTEIKIKVSLLEVVRLLNDFDPQTGNPIYVFSSQQIVSVNAPENLKKKL